VAFPLWPPNVVLDCFTHVLSVVSQSREGYQGSRGEGGGIKSLEEKERTLNRLCLF
jgi:hypothetical protein